VYWSNLGQSAVDFIIARDHEIRTIQVKTAIHVSDENGADHLRVSIAHGASKGKRYRDNAFDLLVVCSPDTRIWVIPFKELPDAQSLQVWHAKHVTGYEKWLVTTKT